LCGRSGHLCPICRQNVDENTREYCFFGFYTHPYKEAIDILLNSKQSFEFDLADGSDLQSEHERYLTENHFKKPVIIYDYPKTIKPFYMRLNDDGETVGAMDILVPRIGELIGGSQREERLDVLEQRMAAAGLSKKNYWWYLDSRRYGTVPHSGFGLGFERLLMLDYRRIQYSGCDPLSQNPGKY
jgi:asparaginyl-tRNA synthetase